MSISTWGWWTSLGSPQNNICLLFFCSYLVDKIPNCIVPRWTALVPACLRGFHRRVQRVIQCILQATSTCWDHCWTWWILTVTMSRALARVLEFGSRDYRQVTSLKNVITKKKLWKKMVGNDTSQGISIVVLTGSALRTHSYFVEWCVEILCWGEQML